MTSQKDKIKILASYLKSLKESQTTLKHSLDLCSDLLTKEKYVLEDFDKLEALTSRYSRISDFLLQKVFRTIEMIELESDSSTIDRINRAHKRGLISDAQVFVNVRELRNTISHEYKEEGLSEIFKLCIRLTPEVLDAVERTIKFCADKYSLK